MGPFLQLGITVLVMGPASSRGGGHVSFPASAGHGGGHGTPPAASSHGASGCHGAGYSWGSSCTCRSFISQHIVYTCAIIPLRLLMVMGEVMEGAMALLQPLVVMEVVAIRMKQI